LVFAVAVAVAFAVAVAVAFAVAVAVAFAVASLVVIPAGDLRLLLPLSLLTPNHCHLDRSVMVSS